MCNDCLVDRMASDTVQSEKWASFIKDDFLRQSMERVKFSLLCKCVLNNLITLITISRKGIILSLLSERGVDMAAWPLIIFNLYHVWFYLPCTPLN